MVGNIEHFVSSFMKALETEVRKSLILLTDIYNVAEIIG